MTNETNNNQRALGGLSGDIILPPVTQETIKPISYSIQTYTINKNTGIVSTGSTATCNTTQSIHCNIAISPGAKFKSISRALLLLKHQSGGEEGFAVYKAVTNGVAEGPAFTHMSNRVDANGIITYKVIDITSLLVGASTQTISLEIESISGSSCSVYTTGSSLEVEYLEDDDFIPNVVKLEGGMGSHGSYSINTRNGKLFYTQKLIQAHGNRMPLNLFVTYNAVDCNETSPNRIATGIKGWTFNYAQTIKTLDRDYILLDSAHKYRRFMPASNNPDVKFDSSAKNGLFLTEDANGFKVTDGNVKTYNFDTNKRLTEIIHNVGENSISTTVIYNLDGKIESITDGMNNTYEFSYLGNVITISLDGDALVKITLEDERIIKIDYLLSTQSYNFTYNTDGMLSIITEVAGNNKIAFSYYDFAAVESVKHYIVKNNTETICNSEFLDYFCLESRVSYSKNSTSKWSSYTTTVYTFNEKGETVSSCENGDGGAFKKVKFRSEEDHEKYVGEVTDDSDFDAENVVGGSFTFEGQKAISGETSDFSSAQFYTSDILNVHVPRYSISNCVFSATLYIANSSYTARPNDSIKLVLEDENGNEIRSLKFDSKKIGYQIKGTMLQLPRGSNRLKVKLVIYGVRAQVVLLGASICEDKNTASFEYITDFVNNNFTIENDGARNLYLNDGTFNLRDEDAGYSNVKYTAKDYLLTTMSRLKNPNSFNIWYNDGKNMLYQVGPRWVLENDYTLNGVVDVKCCTVTKGVNKTTISMLEESELNNGFIKLTTTTMVAKESEDEDGHLFTDYDYFYNTVHYNFRMKPIKFVNEDNIVVEYTYNEFGEVMTEKVYPISNANLYLLSSSEYQNGNLTSTTEKRYDNEYTRMFEYNANNTLANEITANGQYIYYTYTPDGDKLTRLSANVGGVNANDITYAGDLLSGLAHNSTAVTFEYDELNNINNVKIEGVSILSKEITYSTLSTKTLTIYANGVKIKKYYDKYNRLIKVIEVASDETETQICAYLYSDSEVDATVVLPEDSSLNINANSKLRVFVDNLANTRTEYIYDEYGNLKSKQTGDIKESIYKDEYERISNSSFNDGTSIISQNIFFENNYSDKIQHESIQSPAGYTSVAYGRDRLNRPTSITTTQSGNGYKKSFVYVPRGASGSPEGTTNYIESVSYYNIVNNVSTFEKTENVEYNTDGNIVVCGENTYVYDRIGRLTRENNTTLDKTFVFEYNVGGNIVSKNEYAYTEGMIEGEPTKTYAYTYGNAWKDQLTGFDGQSIVYDASGNPTSYLGATLTWSRGRLLTHYTKGSINVAIRYDANGIRMSKQKTSTYTNVNTTYKYDSNGRLRTETQNGVTRRYLYSSDGIVGYEQNGERFLYRKNLFGDIIAIYKGTTKVAEYVYDAWGNCTIVYNMSGYATLNPFRYRGYYWDDDLKMYYLMTRYYDPKTGRFINADAPEYLDPKTINGLNLYSYCNNNPVMNVDPTGHMALSQDDISDIASGLIIILGAILMTLIGISSNDSSNSGMSDIWGNNSFEPDLDWDWLVLPDSLGPGANTENVGFINLHVSVGQATLWLDANKIHSIYANLASVAIFIGFDVEENMYGLFVDVGALNVGYDGRYFDIGLSTLGAGIGLGWQDGELVGKLDPIGYFGVDVSISLGTLIKDLLR